MRREPALILAVVSAVLGVLVSLGLPWLSAEQAGLIIALITAVSGAVTAAFTRPIAPAAFTAVVTAAADLMAVYGLDVSQQTVGAVNGLVVAALALLTRAQVSPAPPGAPVA